MDVIHFKDMVMYQGVRQWRKSGRQSQLAIDHKRMQETGVKWAAVEQDICMRDPFEALRSV